MKAKYYDPMFYLTSEEMPFSIRIEVRLKEAVQPAAFKHAVDTAITRYPYFRMQVVEDAGELLTVPNERPLAVYEGPQVLPLGSAAVNYHMLAFSYLNTEISFHVSHVITDGAGFFPFIKTVLYYYLCEVTGTVLDPKDIRLTDEPFYDDELGNPFPEEAMAHAVPLYDKRPEHYFRLTDGGYVNDSKPMVYRFRVNEAAVFQYNHDNDGSPCSLFSSLMCRAIRALHPDTREDIVSAVSFNQRPGIGNRYNYRLLCSTIMLTYPERLKNADTAMLCTCSRGMVSLQSQPENVLWSVQKRRELIESLNRFPDVKGKQEFLSRIALEDSIGCTFSVSYVGRLSIGAVEPYLDSIYNLTDGSTYRSLFIEVSLTNGEFCISFLQGFSSDVYYKAFLQELDGCGISYREENVTPLVTAKIELP